MDNRSMPSLFCHFYHDLINCIGVSALGNQLTAQPVQRQEHHPPLCFSKIQNNGISESPPGSRAGILAWMQWRVQRGNICRHFPTLSG